MNRDEVSDQVIDAGLNQFLDQKQKMRKSTRRSSVSSHEAMKLIELIQEE